MSRIDAKICDMLDAAGLEWRVEQLSKHDVIMVGNDKVVLLRRSFCSNRRAQAEARCTVKRYLKERSRL
jgi:hypothetical protein